MLKHILIPLVVLVAASNAPVASKQQLPPPQHPVHIKTSVPMDLETMLSRIFPFYRGDPWLNIGRNDFDARYSLSKLGLSNKLIVPVQEPGKTSVPFKGLITKEGIAKEGTVSLVLKIYDQSNGGTKLYEEIHEVVVTQGQYFAIIQVPTETIAKGQTIWLEAASVEEKGFALEPRTQFTTWLPGSTATQGNVSATAISGVAFCRTCGVFKFAGAIPVPSGSMPMEYDYSCVIPMASRNDSFPYLCTSGN